MPFLHTVRRRWRFSKKTALTFEAASAFSDYHPNGPGGLPGGRSILAQPFNGRALGKEIKRLRPPLRELTFAGLMIGSGPELKTSLIHPVTALGDFVATRMASHMRDLATSGRGMRLSTAMRWPDGCFAPR